MRKVGFEKSTLKRDIECKMDRGKRPVLYLKRLCKGRTGLEKDSKMTNIIKSYEGMLLKF